MSRHAAEAAPATLAGEIADVLPASGPAARDLERPGMHPHAAVGYASRTRSLPLGVRRYAMRTLRD